MHISQIEDKTANNLARVELPEEEYHNCIKAAAKALVAAGHGCATYITQWHSGKTVWDLEYGTPLTVGGDGSISF